MSQFDSLDWNALADLWRRIAAAQPQHQQHAERPNWAIWDRIASPGYIGHRYNGVLFVAKNPGSGDAVPSASDRRLFAALERLRSSPDAFGEFNAVHGEVMWGRKLLRYVREIGLPSDSFALINLIKWRGRITAAIRTESWPWTHEQLRLLKPRHLIVLGKTTFQMLQERPLAVDIGRLAWIERTNGDHYMTSVASAQISALRSELTGGS